MNIYYYCGILTAEHVLFLEDWFNLGWVFIGSASVN